MVFHVGLGVHGGNYVMRKEEGDKSVGKAKGEPKVRHRVTEGGGVPSNGCS